MLNCERQVSLIRLHHSVSLPDLFKAKYMRRLRLIATGSRPVDDGLERDIR